MNKLVYYYHFFSF